MFFEEFLGIIWYHWIWMFRSRFVLFAFWMVDDQGAYRGRWKAKNYRYERLYCWPIRYDPKAVCAMTICNSKLFIFLVFDIFNSFNRYYWIIMPLISIVLPTWILCHYFGETLSAAWHVGYVLRHLYTLHDTFLINSFAHHTGMKREFIWLNFTRYA